MKALLDEQLSHEIASLLRERGFDVDAVCERPDLKEASDGEVLDAATSEQRAVVTNDIKDFRPMAATRLTEGSEHAGLVLITARSRRDRNATGALADAIETLMRSHPDGIPNAEHWL